jgi:lipid II:glycine glycyltransferase (peptidoglycan interpeptide bridge formation enzyme)
MATVRVELQRNPDEILGSMRSSARSNIRKAMRKGITVRESGVGGLPTFGELLKDTSRRQRFPPYPLDYYVAILTLFGSGGRAELLLAECGQRVLSGALIIGYGDTVASKAVAWSGERSDLHPNELMHWRAMQWARERGYRYYDLEGIPESVARAKLVGANLPAEGTRGPARFKLGMGGEVTLYPRAYDRSFQPLLVWPARVLAPRLGHFGSVAGRIAGRG